jgi:Family of unknown function (DUF5996)
MTPCFAHMPIRAPKGFKERRVEPDPAAFDEKLGEFLLPYAVVRTAKEPETMLLRFLQSTYEAAAETGKWNRAAIECDLGRPGVPSPVVAPE